MLDIRLHRQVALLLAESYTKFISERRASFFIIEGMKQVGVWFGGGGGGPKKECTQMCTVWFLSILVQIVRCVSLFVVNLKPKVFLVTRCVCG